KLDAMARRPARLETPPLLLELDYLSISHSRPTVTARSGREYGLWRNGGPASSPPRVPLLNRIRQPGAPLIGPLLRAPSRVRPSASSAFRPLRPSLPVSPPLPPPTWSW